MRSVEAHSEQPVDYVQLAQSAKFAIVVAQFNPEITSSLFEAAQSSLREAGVDWSAVNVFRVPGAFELPVVAHRLAMSGEYDAILTLGCVIEGETDHYEHICRTAADGIAASALQTGVPIIFGVLTARTQQQAQDRAGGAHGNLGSEYAQSLLHMCAVMREVEA